MIKSEIGHIVKISRPEPEILDFWLSLPVIASMALPGQFLHILCGEHTLRRPISICDCDVASGSIRILFEVRGEGTAWLAGRKAGEEIDVLGPVGHGFLLKPSELQAAGYQKPFTAPVFVGGGIGVPPLLFAARQVNHPSAVLGFRSADRVILQDDFAALGNTIIATEDGSSGVHGFVTKPLEELIVAGKADILYACGPTPMLKSVKSLAEKYNIPCQLSLEARMACGVGACLGCACKTRIHDTEQYSHVCKNGPVFWSKEVCFDE